MDINSLIVEIDSIDIELKRLRGTVKELNTRKKKLTEEIIKIIQETDEESMSFNGVTYSLGERVYHTRKSGKKRLKDVINILEEEGITGQEAENVYLKLESALKGPEKTVVQLKK